MFAQSGNVGISERQRPPVVVDALYAQGATVLGRRNLGRGKVRNRVVVVIVVAGVCVCHDRAAPDAVGVGEMVAAGIGISSRAGIVALPVAVPAPHVVARLVAHRVAAVDGVYVADVAGIVLFVEFGRDVITGG